MGVEVRLAVAALVTRLSEVGGHAAGPGEASPGASVAKEAARAVDKKQRERAASCRGLSDRELSVVCCRNGGMNLAVWAERNGVARVTAYRWFRGGLLPVPARKVGRLILVDDPSVPAGPRSRTAVYAGPRLIRQWIWIVRWRG